MPLVFAWLRSQVLRTSDATDVASSRGPQPQFNARVIPSVAYTDPEVAWVGLTEDQARAQGIKVKKGLFPWTASGGGMAGTHAGDMIGECITQAGHAY